MVELELLQRRERPVALLGERQPPLFELVGLVEPVVRRAAGLAQERQRDESHARDREHGADDERRGHARTVAPA